MRSTLDLIEEWLAKAERAKYRASDLAMECRDSQRQLCRYFHDHCGTSPQKWLNRVRGWNYLPLLLETQYAAGVARQLHFERVATFSEVFRRHFGCPSREFIVNPDKTLDHLFAKSPSHLEANGSILVSELSKLARGRVEFLRRERK